MQDRPDAIELIAAAIQFLNEEILPVIDDPRLRFRTLIAANVLKIVERELSLGDAPLVAEWQQLITLLSQPEQTPPASGAALQAAVAALNRELCVQIRAGAADEGPWGEAVLAHVEAVVVEKLRVANPRYLMNYNVEISK